MAKKHQGALVVFPGREPIQEWVAGGYALDVRSSIPMLQSIFDPNSPGHDGALIVERGRFARLGVRLPVSQSQQLSDDYGTRHHAALGLAAKSDALTVLVSEERGQVSVFYKGRMRPIEDAKRIFQALPVNTAVKAISNLQIDFGADRPKSLLVPSDHPSTSLASLRFPRCFLIS
jgi:DNA integrity scanning protein DisA with diadenylate cyclase activity